MRGRRGRGTKFQNEDWNEKFPKPAQPSPLCKENNPLSGRKRLTVLHLKLLNSSKRKSRKGDRESD